MSHHAPDLISELLRGMRLSGVKYRRIEASSPFGARSDDGEPTDVDLAGNPPLAFRHGA